MEKDNQCRTWSLPFTACHSDCFGSNLGHVDGLGDGLGEDSTGLEDDLGDGLSGGLDRVHADGGVRGNGPPGVGNTAGGAGGHAGPEHDLGGVVLQLLLEGLLGDGDVGDFSGHDLLLVEWMEERGESQFYLLWLLLALATVRIRIDLLLTLALVISAWSFYCLACAEF